MIRYLLASLLLCATAFGSAATVFITQNGAGTKDGTTLGNAGACDAVANTPQATCAFFNNAANWGAGATQIGQDTVVIASGTITGSAGAGGYFNFQASGVSGHPITLRITGIVQSTHWAANSGGSGCIGGAVCMSSRSFVTLDGGGTGVIQNTDNGSVLGSHVASVGVDGYSCTSCSITNIAINNIYVNVSGNSVLGDASFARCMEITGSGWTIDHFTMHDAGFCIVDFYANGDSNLTISNSTFVNYGHGLALATASPNAFNNLFFFNNDLGDASNWSSPTCFAHQDGIHMYGIAGSSIDNAYVYNNYFHGSYGTCPTGFVFVEAAGSGTPSNLKNSYWWNNVMVVTAAGVVNSSGWFELAMGAGGVQKVFNNVIIGPNATDNTACMLFQGLGGLTYENNVVSNCGNPITINSSTITAVDHNVYGPDCLNGGNCFVFNGSFKGSFTNWKTACACDGTGSIQTSSPLLNADGSPQAGSPVIGAGLNLTSSATGNFATLSTSTTKGGNLTGSSRPTSAAWDDGAYQFVSTPQAATPTFSPVSSTYATRKTITISDTTAGALICWNIAVSVGAINGSATCPSGSVPYTGTFTLDQNTTVFARAGGPGFTDSAVASIVYTFNLVAQLPQNPVNNLEYIGTTSNTINFPNSWQCGVTTYGPYANTMAGLQSAVNNAETCRHDTNAGTTIKIAHGSLLSAANGITLNQTAGDVSTNFIVLTSDTPLPLGVTACSHGIQDNLTVSTQPGIRNAMGCNGSHMSYWNGSADVPINYDLGTLVSTGNTPFTLANGTATNTSAYNDVASMYTIECSALNCNPFKTAGVDANGVAPHHFAVLNAEVRLKSGSFSVTQLPGSLFLTGTGHETALSQLPNHIHLAYSYLHGDWPDAPVSGGVATATVFGTTYIPNDVAWVGCQQCSLVYSYLDQSDRPGAEGHLIQMTMAQQIKIVHNWMEGQNTGTMCGGIGYTLGVVGFTPCTDVEDGDNRWTYPFSWELAAAQGFTPNGLGDVFGRKNAHEQKGAERYLMYGNIIEHSENSGGQNGQLISFKTSNGSATTTLPGNYWIRNENNTFENNIVREGCQGMAWGFRSSIDSANGAGSTLPTETATFRNNLLYDISGGGVKPWCVGASPPTGFRFAFNASDSWAATATRDATGTIVTLVLTSPLDGGASGVSVGDPVAVRLCTDTSFNTMTAPPTTTVMGPPALAPTSPDGTTIYYANAGTPNATDSTCRFSQAQGYAAYLNHSHNTDILVFQTNTTDPNSSASGGNSAFNLARNISLQNDIFIGGAFSDSAFGEGTRTQTKLLDAPSETFNNDIITARQGAGCPGNTGANCYTEYGGVNDGVSPPVTVYLTPTGNCTTNDPTVGNCVGVLGGMSSGSALSSSLSDWHQYRLCHPGDAACNGKASVYSATQANDATDGTDLGANIAQIEAAQTLLQYPSPGFFPDAPLAVPATFFGLHWKISNFPPLVPSGSVRLWDSLTRWQLLNPSNGVFDFTNLDTNLQDAKTLGVDVLFTLSTTPNYISSDPTNATCNYNSTATGGCGVPTDIAASCTNVNGNRNCDGKVDGTNQHWRTWVYTAANHITGLDPNVYAIPSSYEIWNEASQQGTSGAGTCAQIGGTSWEGTCAQMVKMYSDANCILTGRGLGCSAGAMGVPAVGIFPSAIVTSPSSVMTAPESNWYGAYLLTSGATTNMDVAAVHAYTQIGPCPPNPCAAPETVVTRYTTAASKTSAASFTGPIWSTEGGWGQVASEPDVDLQAAFVARYYLLGWNAGFKRLYWYSYDSLFGTLWTSGGGLTKAGVSYGQIYGWMVGSILSTPCAAVGTVWSCVLTTSTGDHLIMWDTAQTCSGGSCTTANQPVASTWLAYQDMTTASTPIAVAASHQVPIGAKPVIFQQSVVTHGAGVNPVILGMNRGPE